MPWHLSATSTVIRVSENKQMPAELESHLLTFLFSAMFQTVSFYYKHTHTHTHTHAEHVCPAWALTYGVSTATRQKVSALMQKGGCLSCQKA